MILQISTSLEAVTVVKCSLERQLLPRRCEWQRQSAMNCRTS